MNDKLNEIIASDDENKSEAIRIEEAKKFQCVLECLEDVKKRIKTI